MGILKKNVAIIPPTKSKKTNSFLATDKLKVAAYCRVSTLQDQQESSYEAQVDYYTEKINENPNWKLAGIFADDGKSATQTAQRDNFNALIDACMKGKIDLVLTKSISRFSRNTVDALQTIRKLKERNIPIIFEKEGINTMETGGELLITILSSQAQEESRNISENIRWGIIRKFENGIPSINHKRFLGYTKDEAGNLVIVPEEALTVRRIFKEYLEGKSLDKIAKSLDADGILTVTGLNHWHVGTINRILSSEKMCGDSCMQKTYTVDYLTKKRVKNDGYVPSYYLEDSHEGIISKELFKEVQNEKARRANLKKPKGTKAENQDSQEKSKFSSKFILTELLVCAHCNHGYKRQVWSKYGEKTAVWRCEDRLKQGVSSTCKQSPTIKEVELQNTIMRAINKVVDNQGEFIELFRENVMRVMNSYENKEEEINHYYEKIKELENQMLQLMEENTKQGRIDKNFEKKYSEHATEIKKLREEKKVAIENQKLAKKKDKRIAEASNVLNEVNGQVMEFDQDLIKRLVQTIRVYKGMGIEIQFYSGIVMVEEIY